MNMQEFIESRPYLFWSTKSVDTLSPEAVVEAVLNYGDFEDVKQLLSLLGTSTVGEIFHKQLQQKRNNYEPRIAHYFSLYFAKHA